MSVVKLVACSIIAAPWLFGLASCSEQQPEPEPQRIEIVIPCPAEDACGTPTIPAGWDADYRDGAWHITNLTTYQ